MTDFQGFWQAFLLLFAVLPAIIGASMGLAWGWRKGRRGANLLPASLLGAGAAGVLAFAGAVLLFRA